MKLPEEGLTRRQRRVIKRKEKLELLADKGILFCSHHEHYLCVEDVSRHHCYAGSKGKSYCKYIKAEVDGRFYNPFKF